VAVPKFAAIVLLRFTSLSSAIDERVITSATE